MLSALRVLWVALVGLYDEPVTLLQGNLSWLALNLPLYAATCLMLALAVAATGTAPTPWPFLLAAILVLLLPTPASLGLAGLARTAATQEAPRLDELWLALRQTWRRGLAAFLLAALGLGVVLANVVFYATVVEGMPRLLAIAWAWVAVAWLAVNQLVAPLTLHLRGVGLLGTYRRAALLIASYPLFWLVQVAAGILVAVLCVVVLPLYLLAGGAYVALVQAHAFRALRQAAGDFEEDPAA